MPVRSSVCTYSPSNVSNSKYSSPNSLSIGLYRPLSSSTYGSGSGSSTSSGFGTSNRYSLSTSSSYKPSSLSSNPYSSVNSASSYTSSTGHYRPLSSTHSSFTGSRYGSNNPALSSTGSGYTRYSSGSSAGSTSSSSLSSASSLLDRGDNGGYSSISNYSHQSPSSSRRISYTSASNNESLPSEVPRGLINLGNTCYMNSAIQSLYSIESLRNLILRASHDKILTSEISDLFKSMKNSSSPVSPANFKYAFSRHQSKFSGFGQQDAQEFLRYLINGIHEEMNYASRKPRRSVIPKVPKSAEEAWSQYKDIVDDSPLVDIVVGQMCSTIVCSVCQNKSYCWDPFWDLSLPLVRGRHSHKLSDVVQDFVAKETLDGDERPVCSYCKKATRSTKQINVLRLPEVMILHLKKFTNDGYKLTSPEINIDEVLTFNKINYNLQACISHHGYSSSSGHYTSHCKYTSKWFHFNDDRTKVWPLSVDSLDYPELSLRESKAAGRDRLRSIELKRKLKPDPITKLFICSSISSDVCFVSGVILTITGALVASLGIYPNNQAQIRIYLECFGCCMIILGVLIIFLSAKMRRRHSIKSELVIHDFRRTKLAHTTSGDLKGKKGGSRDMRMESEERSTLIENSGLNLSSVGVYMISETLELTELSKIENESSTKRAMVMLIPRIVDNHLGKLDFNSNININTSEFEAVINNVTDGREGEGEEDDEEELADNNWIPDKVSYREGHQAAIATALSTVLTVSTLAGFRFDEGREHHCCLHHAVQHKLRALKWIKNLKNTGRNRSNSPLERSKLTAV